MNCRGKYVDEVIKKTPSLAFLWLELRSALPKANM